jgi:Hypothetical glycosyl hydrolase 6
VTTRWWERPFRTFQTNLREIDAGLDVERTLDAIEAHGADSWLLSVGGIIANHPSRLASQTVNPHLAQRPSGDLVGDAVAAASARGIRVLGRMDFSKVDARRAEQHPEWCFVGPDGEPQVYNGYRSVCPSGDYYQREMFDVIAEVLGTYALAGFFLNWMSFNEVDYSRAYRGVCRCEACHRGFAAFAPGVALPVGPGSAGYGRWREYSAGVLADLHARLRAHVAELAPEAALIQGGAADVTFHEANNAVGRPLWHLATAEAVSAARTVDPARPVFVNAVAFVDMPYRWAGEDPHHLAQHLLQAIAHGAQPSTYIMGTPEHSDFDALGPAGEITRFHRDHEELYAGLRSTARVALVRPEPSPGQAERARAEFEGWCLALSESHVPFDVLAAGRLAEVDPTRFALVVLPDVGELDPAAIALLDALVDRGASVVTTGSSAWSAGTFQLGGAAAPVTQRAEFTTEESLRSLHLALGRDRSQHVPVVGGFRVLAPGEGTTTAWPALGRSLYGPPEKCYGNEETDHPGWVSRSRGGGGALSILPWLPGLLLRQVGLAVVRDELVAAVLATSREPLRVRTALPDRVQLVPGTTGRAEVLHLLNRSGDAPQRFLAPLPIAPAELSVTAERRPVSVRAHVADVDLEWSWADGTLRIALPEIGLFEAVETRWNNN